MARTRIHPNYDIIIVGAGVAGLHVAGELARRHPGMTICILEKYKTLGGRTLTYIAKPTRESSNPVHWESGAARVHKSHRLVHALLKKHGLRTIDIDSRIGYMEMPGSAIVPNVFETVILPVFLSPFTRLDPDVLARHTLSDLLRRVFGDSKAEKLMSWFPYRSELTTLRADVALTALLGAGSMASHKDYSVVEKGFGELIARLVSALPSRVTILGRHAVTDVVPGPENSCNVTVTYNGNKKMILRAERACIMAVHSTGLRAITPFQTYAPLRHLKTEPLLRIYMIFPGAKPWFAGVGRVVFPGGLRYMIPVDESRGVIMISYTDAGDTTRYSGLVEKYGDESAELTGAVMRDVRRWFHDLEIPAPIYTKAHLWNVGTTYWLPLKRGETYKSVEDLSAQCSRPYPKKMPGLYVCGESYSAHKQAWIEGALESAEEVLKKIKI